MISSFVNNMKYHVRCEMYNHTGTNKIELRFIEPENLFINDIEITLPDLTYELRLTLDGTVSPEVHKIAFYNGGGVLIDTLNLDDTTAEYYPVDVFTFDGLYLSFGSTIPSNPNVTWALLLQKTWEYLSIYLYNFTCEKNVVTKTSYLTNTRLVRGQLEEETDITKPSLLIDTESFNIDIFSYNYAYIRIFKRYYFIDKIVSVRMNIYRIYLSVDVLYTYDSDIRTQDAFITRNEDDTSGSIIADERYPVESKMSVSYVDVNSVYPTPIATNIKNVTFNQTINTGYRWVVTGLMKNALGNRTHEVIAPTGSNLPDIKSVYPADTSIGTKMQYYALTEEHASYFNNAIMKDSALSSYIMSYVYYPFDVTSILNNTLYSLSSIMTINDADLTDYVKGTFETALTPQGSRINVGTIANMGYVITADFKYEVTLGNNTDFLYYEPFRYYELWIAFVGWVKIDAERLINNRIIVYYGIDLSSGMATAYIKKYGDDEPFFSASCQVGTRLPVTTTNEEELTRMKQNNVLNLGIGLVSAGVSAGIGVASGNPVAVVGGVLSGAKSIANSVNANNMMFERAQTSLFSSETSFYGDISKVMLRITYHDNLSDIDDSVYFHMQGKKVNTYKALTSVTGYTEIGELHYIPSTLTYITKPEMDEIVSIARDGIIL